MEKPENIGTKAVPSSEITCPYCKASNNIPSTIYSGSYGPSSVRPAHRCLNCLEVFIIPFETVQGGNHDQVPEQSGQKL